jgi:thiol:disulfide interchange protein DsbC
MIPGGKTMRKKILAAMSLLTMLLSADPALAFRDNDASKSSCADYRALTLEDAESALRGIVDNVVDVVPGPFPGIREVDAAVGGRVYPIYIDCSGKYLFQGQIIRLSDKESLTRLRYEELNRVDVSSIPLKDAIVLGNGASKKRIIVLTDPSCPYCVRLHGEIRKAVAKDPEAAFLILPYPRNRDDKANYAKCLAAVCDKSGKLLDDAFSGKEVPPPTCESDGVEETIRLAERLRIPGTPAMILPDGRVVSGYRDADALLSLIR